MPEQSDRVKILHVITSLGGDGAQQMLLKVTSRMDSTRFENQVVSLHADYAEGSLRAHFENAGVRVFDLGLKRSIPSLRALRQLVRLIRSEAPHFIQGWMYHGNLAASLARRFAGGKARLLWNIRHSVYDLGAEKFQTRQVIRLGGLLSSWADRIVYCAEIAAVQHVRLGYAPDKSVVIPNGFDITRFQPSDAAKRALRESLRLPQNALIVGNVGRYHAQKGHEKLLRAAALVVREFPQAHFVLVGRDLLPSNPAIAALISELDLSANVHLLGQIPEIMPGFDIYCLASVHGEGFPNVLGEAMSCGVPCIATDIGASAEIVGGIGEVVPPAKEVEMAEAILAMLRLPAAALRQKSEESRSRVLERYTLPKVVTEYEHLYSR